jgi:hypothetical protein
MRKHPRISAANASHATAVCRFEPQAMKGQVTAIAEEASALQRTVLLTILFP